MRRASKTIILSSLFVVFALSVFAWTTATGDFSAKAEEAKSTEIGLHPVDDDMHHFMEYVFEPNYKRLKARMADEPRDKNAWSAIKGDSLTLAECANLLLTRAPDADADQWRELSASVRAHGGELYQAARKSDYTAARKAYVTMLTTCNACHTQFADGEHQLQP